MRASPFRSNNCLLSSSIINTVVLLKWPNAVAENLALYVLKWGKNVHPWIIGSWRYASFIQGGKIQFGTQSQLLRASKYGFLDIKNDVVKHVMPNSRFSLLLENKQRGLKQLGYTIRSTVFLPNLWRFWWISDFYVANTSVIMASNWMPNAGWKEVRTYAVTTPWVTMTSLMMVERKDSDW